MGKSLLLLIILGGIFGWWYHVTQVDTRIRDKLLGDQIIPGYVFNIMYPFEKFYRLVSYDPNKIKDSLNDPHSTKIGLNVYPNSNNNNNNIKGKIPDIGFIIVHEKDIPWHSICLYDTISEVIIPWDSLVYTGKYKWPKLANRIILTQPKNLNETRFYDQCNISL